MLRNLLHQTGIHGHAADPARRSHEPIKQNGQRQPRRKRRQRHGEGEQQHGERNRPPRSHARQSASEHTARSEMRPRPIRHSAIHSQLRLHETRDRSAEPSRPPRHHRAQKQSPTVPRKTTLRCPRKKSALRASRAETSDCRFRRLDIMTQLTARGTTCRPCRTAK